MRVPHFWFPDTGDEPPGLLRAPGSGMVGWVLRTEKSIHLCLPRTQATERREEEQKEA